MNTFTCTLKYKFSRKIYVEIGINISKVEGNKSEEQIQNGNRCFHKILTRTWDGLSDLKIKEKEESWVLENYIISLLLWFDLQVLKTTLGS